MSERWVLLAWRIERKVHLPAKFSTRNPPNGKYHGRNPDEWQTFSVLTKIPRRTIANVLPLLVILHSIQAENLTIFRFEIG